MVSFTDKWNALKNNEKLSQAFMGKVKPDAPLKNKLDTAQKKLQVQINRLEEIDTKLKEHMLAIKVLESCGFCYSEVQANQDRRTQGLAKGLGNIIFKKK